MATPPDFTNGTALDASSLDRIGLWEIQTQTVSGQQNVDFINVFDSDYVGYRILWHYTQNTTRGDLNFQFRDASGVMAGNNYTFGWGGSYAASGTPQFAGFSYQTTPTSTAFAGSGATPTARTSGFLEFQNPQFSGSVYAQGQGASVNFAPTLLYVFIVGGISHDITTATRTGFRLACSAGTMTGTFTLLGYRK
jgi:hypothetical protein